MPNEDGPDPFWMSHALGTPQKCGENVSRKGEEQPCDKPAVALRIEPEEPDQCYPVCAYHARADMVTLERIVRFFLDRDEARRRVVRGADESGEPVTEVHARWSGHGGKTFCGEKGDTVTIRHPDDWETVTCPTCLYAAMKEET